MQVNFGLNAREIDKLIQVLEPHKQFDEEAQELYQRLNSIKICSKNFPEINEEIAKEMWIEFGNNPLDPQGGC